MVRKLPEFKGYTVDFRLKQFRNADINAGMEFVDFESEKGDYLLYELIKDMPVKQIIELGIFE